jgi:hypothetical protein
MLRPSPCRIHFSPSRFGRLVNPSASLKPLLSNHKSAEGQTTRSFPWLLLPYRRRCGTAPAPPKAGLAEHFRRRGCAKDPAARLHGRGGLGQGEPFHGSPTGNYCIQRCPLQEDPFFKALPRIFYLYYFMRGEAPRYTCLRWLFPLF